VDGRSFHTFTTLSAKKIYGIITPERQFIESLNIVKFSVASVTSREISKPKIDSQGHDDKKAKASRNCLYLDNRKSNVFQDTCKVAVKFKSKRSKVKGVRLRRAQTQSGL